MQTINCHIPLKLRLMGEPTEDQWDALEQALVVQYTGALQRSLQALERAGHLSIETEIREPFDPSRLRGETYLIPSYDEEGKPAPAPVTAPAQPSSPADMIRQRYTSSQGKPSNGVYYGVYLVEPGKKEPRLFYLLEDGTVKKVWLSSWSIDYAPKDRDVGVMIDLGVTLDLPPGSYTFVKRVQKQGQLYRDGELFCDADIYALGSDAEIIINFFVPGGASEPQRAVREFVPHVEIVRLDGLSDKMTTHSKAAYLANVDIWRYEPDGSWDIVPPLAAIYWQLDISWQVWKISTDPKNPGLENRELVREVKAGGNNFFLRFTWEDPGQYIILCTVKVNWEDAYPFPVHASRRDDVIRLEFKMAADLALMEKIDVAAHKDRAKGDPLWAQSAHELIEMYEKELAGLRAAAHPNKALIESIEDAIEGIKKQLNQDLFAGPYPIRAIFTELATGKSRPIALFIAPYVDPVPYASTSAWTWKLIDVTYPAFYATYTGSGDTQGEALRDAFESLRNSSRSKYPPGRILAHVEYSGMEEDGLQPFDFVSETESTKRDALEWLAFGAKALGFAVLAASLVVPGSAFLTGAIIVSMVAGAAVSVLNIAERINTNTFEWDAEAITDVVSIATSFAFASGAAAKGAAGVLSKSLLVESEVSVGSASVKLVNLETVATIAKLAKFRRAMLFIGVAGDVTNGVIIAHEVYEQIKRVDAMMSDAMLEEYKQQYGDEEGLERFNFEREAQIAQVLARGAVSELLVGASIRMQGKEIVDLLPRRTGIDIDLGGQPGGYGPAGEPIHGGTGDETVPTHPADERPPTPDEPVRDLGEAPPGGEGPPPPGGGGGQGPGPSPLQPGRHTKLREEMREIENVARTHSDPSVRTRTAALHARRMRQLAALTPRELDGLEQIARLEYARVDWGDTLETVLQWSPQDRADLFGVIADVAPHVHSGMEEVLHGILGRDIHMTGVITGVQGGWGQLYAARSIIERYGGRNLQFEVARVDNGLAREVDIVADTPFGKLNVEVKTNIDTAASRELDQMRADLVAHANTGYADLLYLYHPSVAGQVDTVGRRMLRLFDEPELQAMFAQARLDLDKARQACARWLETGGMTVYRL